MRKLLLPGSGSDTNELFDLKLGAIGDSAARQRGGSTVFRVAKHGVLNMVQLRKAVPAEPVCRTMGGSLKGR